MPVTVKMRLGWDHDSLNAPEIARRAGELGMAVPSQPGILAVQENGDIVEQRPADPATSPIIDVNGAPVRRGQASSDADASDERGDNRALLPVQLCIERGEQVTLRLDATTRDAAGAEVRLRGDIVLSPERYTPPIS